MRSVTMAFRRVVVGSAAAAVASAAASAPNFIWIMSDDLGYGEISAMPGRNNTNITTPNIDALFHSGTTFTDAYCGEAVCAPSRGSLMTAKHTGHATIRGNIGGKNMPHGLPLAANDTTVLNVMQDNGYHVACIGKVSERPDPSILQPDASRSSDVESKDSAGWARCPPSTSSTI